MNVLNRLVALLLLIGIIALVVTIFIWPLQTINWAQHWLSAAETSITVYTWPIILAGGIVIILLAFILILIELFARRRRKTVKVRNVRGGNAELRTESIGRRIAWHLDRLADVVKVTPRVKAKGSGVDIVLNLETGPHVDVPMKTEEVLAVVREQVEVKMGLKLRSVDVKIKNAPFSAEPQYVQEAEQSWSPPVTAVVEEPVDSWVSAPEADEAE